MHLPRVLATLLLLATVESGFYDYDNEVYDYYRGESSNNVGQSQSQRSAAYRCEEEGFHEDPNDCRAFYRCVDYGNGSPLTPFKFECGPGTVFSTARGNVCVRPVDSGRQECCEPGNEIDSNEPDYDGGDGWNDGGGQQQQPSYPPAAAATQRPQSPSYLPPQTQRPSHGPPPQTQRPTYPPSITQQTQRPSYGPPQTQRPTYPPSTQQTQRPSYGPPPQTQRPTYPPSITQQTQRPSYGPPQTPRPTYPPQTQSPPGYPSTQRPAEQPGGSSTGCTGAPGGSASGGCGNSPGCSQEGFFPNPQDCHKFYRCVDEETHLQRYDFTCGSGTAWDQQLQTCNHEHEVVGCSGSSPQGGGPDGYPSSSRPPTSQSTQQPGGSHYPPSSQRPTEPPYPYPPSQYPTQQPPSYPTQGTQRPTQYPTQSPSYPTQGTQRPTQYPTQPPSYPSQGTQRPTQYPTQSPSYPTQGTQRPTQYPTQQPPSYPSQGTQRPTQYPTQSPSYPSSSTKGPEYVPPPPPAGSTSRPSYPTGGGPPTEAAPGTGGRPCAPGGSSADCKEEGFFPNPQDCHKFFRCVNEADSFRRYDFECGTGTAWDQQLQTCNYEDAVGCSASSSADGGQPQQPPETGVSPGGNQPGSGAGPEGQQQQQQQPPGSTSRPPTSQSSQSTSRPYPGSSQAPTTENPQSTGAGYPSSSRRPEGTQRPPSESQSTSRPGGGGGGGGGGGAQPPASSSGACQGEGFFPNPSDCRKFIRCVSNPPSYIKYEFDCAPGTAWDQNLLTCNYIHLVASCDQSQNEIEPNQPPSSGGYPTGPPSTAGSTSSTPSSGGYPSGPPSGSTLGPPVSGGGGTTQAPLEENKTEPSQQSTTSSEGSSSSSSESSTSSSSTESGSGSGESGGNKPDCNPPKKNTTIVCDSAGFYPHPTRCDKFYRCVDNGKGFNVYYFDCPPGTIFDPSIDVCNYPESVYPARDCENAGAQPPPSASTQAPSSSTSAKPGPSGETTTKQPGAEATTTSESSTTESAGTTGLTPTESSEATTPSSEATTPGAEATTPGSEGTTSGSEGTTQNPEATTTSSEATTSSTEESTTPGSTTPSGGETTTPGSSTETAATSTAAPEEQQSTTSPMSQETTTAAATGTTEPQESTTPAAPAGSSEKPPSVDNCPSLANLTDEQIVLVCPTGFRRHPKLCNLFYQCTSSGMEVKILILQCPDGTIFDQKDNKCLAEADSSEPCMGAIAGKRTRRVAGQPSTAIEVSTKPLCPDEGHFPYRHGCSNVFYKCKRDTRSALQGYLYKCPKDFVYWSVSRRCERASRLPMCTRMSNETEFENEAWENRWEIPVEDRNLSARSLMLQ